MKRKLATIVSLVIVGSVVLVWYLSLSLAQTPPESEPFHTLTPTSDPCFLGWAGYSEAKKDACIERAGGLTELKATHDALRRATVQARPSTAPMSGLKTVAAQVAARPPSTPTPTFLPNGLPGWYDKIRPIKPEERYKTSIGYLYYESVWHVSGVVSESGVPYMLDVMTLQDQCVLETLTINPYDYLDRLEEYEKKWSCPQDVGEIVITGATGPTGIVTFTTTLSQSGTFNLATEEWTLEGEPWLPVPTVD